MLLSRLLALAAPVMIARSGHLLLVVVDSAMSARASTHALAAYGIAVAAQMPFFLMGIGLITGIVLVLAGLFHLGPWALPLLGQPPGLAASASATLAWLGWSMPGAMVLAALTLFCEGLGRPQPGMLAILGANVLNVPLNGLLMEGSLAEAWGLEPSEGAAIATGIVRYAAALGLLAWMGVRLPQVRSGLAHARTLSRAHRWGVGSRLLRFGGPVALAQGLESGAFASMTLFAGLLGELEVGAFQVALNLIALPYMAALGFGTAASVEVGRALGGGRTRVARRAGWGALALLLGLDLWLAALYLLAPGWLVSLYTADPRLVPRAVAAVSLASLVLILDGAQGALMGALRGASDLWPATGLFLLSFWGLMIPAGYLLGVQWGWGAPGLVAATGLGCLAASLALGWRFATLPALREERARGG